MGSLMSQPKCHEDITIGHIKRLSENSMLTMKAELLPGMELVICTWQELGSAE